jgi:hypothetical protein
LVLDGWECTLLEVKSVHSKGPRETLLVGFLEQIMTIEGKILGNKIDFCWNGSKGPKVKERTNDVLLMPPKDALESKVSFLCFGGRKIALHFPPCSTLKYGLPVGSVKPDRSCLPSNKIRDSFFLSNIFEIPGESHDFLDSGHLYSSIQPHTDSSNSWNHGICN